MMIKGHVEARPWRPQDLLDDLQKMIDEGRFKNIAELANVLGIDPGAVARTIRLTLLSPKIIHKIIAGEVNLLQEQYRQSFPDSWEEQEKFFFPQ